MRGLGWVAIGERIAVMREGRKHELHAIQIQRRVGEVAIQIHTADPLRFGRDANAIRAENRARGMRAMSAFIIG